MDLYVHWSLIPRMPRLANILSRNVRGMFVMSLLGQHIGHAIYEIAMSTKVWKLYSASISLRHVHIILVTPTSRSFQRRANIPCIQLPQRGADPREYAGKYASLTPTISQSPFGCEINRYSSHTERQLRT